MYGSDVAASRSRNLPTVLSSICMSAMAGAAPLALLAAGILKAAHADAFAGSLAEWRWIPLYLAPAIAMWIINVELLIGLCWLLGVVRSIMRSAACLLLLIYGLALLLHAHIFGNTPACRCFGFDHPDAASAPAGPESRVLINGVLIAATLVGSRVSSTGCFFIRVPRSARPDLNGLIESPRADSKHGFTVIEMLVVIACIAAILVLTLPSLVRSRRHADDAASMIHLRQHVMAVASYNADYQERMPHFTSPDERVVFNAGPYRIAVEYFTGYSFWHLALCDSYYEGDPFARYFFPPGYLDTLRPGLVPFVTQYWYSQAYLADPAYWTVERRIGPSQWRSTRAPEVSFPANKAVLIECWPYVLDYGALGMSPAEEMRRPGIGFVDGSARRIQRNAILPGHPEGTGVLAGNAMIHDFPTLYTLSGVKGRDAE